MTKQSPQNLIDELDTILEVERENLIAGAYDEAEKLVERKEEIIDLLRSHDDVPLETLEDVNTKLGRNQELLGSALQGIKAVSQRLQELRKVKRGLEVYDQTGKRASFATSGSRTLEKRA